MAQSLFYPLSSLKRRKDRLISQSRRQEKRREAEFSFRRFFEIGARRKARGYFGAAERLRDFEIFRCASVLFPPTTRRLKGENKRRVMNVKGAERISFSVRHAAFLLFPKPNPKPITKPISYAILEICIKSEILNLKFQPYPIWQQYLHQA